MLPDWVCCRHCRCCWRHICRSENRCQPCSGMRPLIRYITWEPSPKTMPEGWWDISCHCDSVPNIWLGFWSEMRWELLHPHRAAWRWLRPLFRCWSVPVGYHLLVDWFTVIWLPVVICCHCLRYLPLVGKAPGSSADTVPDSDRMRPGWWRRLSRRASSVGCLLRNEYPPFFYFRPDALINFVHVRPS